MWPGKIIEGLKEGHTPSHLGPILTETLAFSHQRRQGMTRAHSHFPGFKKVYLLVQKA
jgi:hypothetical protein